MWFYTENLKNYLEFTHSVKFKQKNKLKLLILMLLRCSLGNENSRNSCTFCVCLFGPKIRSCKLFLTNLMSGSLNHSVYIGLFGATSVAALLHSLSLWHCPKRVGRMLWPSSADGLPPSAVSLLPFLQMACSPLSAGAAHRSVWSLYSRLLQVWSKPWHCDMYLF